MTFHGQTVEISAYAPITSRDDDADAARAKFHELVAHVLCIIWRDILLVAGVRYHDCLWEGLLCNHKGEPIDVWICGTTWLAAYAVEEVRCRVGHG